MVLGQETTSIFAKRNKLSKISKNKENIEHSNVESIKFTSLLNTESSLPKALKTITQSFSNIEKEQSSKDHTTTNSREKNAAVDIQTLRLHILRRYCERKGPSKLDQMTAIRRMYTTIYNNENKVIYCAVPKAACSNWKRIFMVFEHLIEKPADVAATSVHGWFYKLLYKTDKKNITRILNSYYSFVFVREPYERLISAYRDKFTDKRTKDYLREYKVDILREHRKNLTEEQYLSGMGVTFKEFILSVIKTFKEKGVTSLNEHWRPVTSICYPCRVHYNFIGHQETLNEDFIKVMETINVKDTKLFPEANSKYEINSKTLIPEYYAQFSEDTLSKLYEIYEDDYEAFGYPKPNFEA